MCGRTVCAGCDRDDDGQRPVKDEGENDECNDNVDKSGNDIEQDKLWISSELSSLTRRSTHLKNTIDGRASVQNPEYFPGLATHMPRERKVQKVVERKLRHS